MADESDESGQSNDRSRSFGRGGPGGRGSRTMIQPDAVPKPASRSRLARNPFVVFGNAIFVILVLLTIGSYFGLRRFQASGPLAEEKTVYVPRGNGRDEIADSLERQGVIDGADTFTTGVWLLGHGNDLKAGEYAFKPGASMYEVMNQLVEGKVIQHSLTIPEGWTSQMVIDRLAQEDMLSGDAPPVPKEGSLLPDTYKFERGDTRAKLVKRMQDEQKAVLDQVWKDRAPNLPLKSPADLVTLASIVEKETGQADERPHVASVFINRLTHSPRMRLESDPTAIYGVLLGKARPEGSTAASFTTQDTPYNTYKIFGLPPGPIANPGRAAMEAVANPLATNDLFFVANGTGGHAFAATLEEHNRNINAWHQTQQNASPAPALQDPAPQAAPDTQAAPPPAAPPTPAPPTPSGKKGKGKKQQPAAVAPAPVVPAPAAQPQMAQPAPTPPAVTLPPAANGVPPVAPAPGTDAAKAPAAKPPIPKGAFDDPVANTKQDPLLDKSFDLNSPQNVQ